MTGYAVPEPPLAPRVVVLVEGDSDAIVVQVLAARRGRDLAAEQVAVIAMGGVTNVGQYLQRYGPPGLGVRVVGLYDAPEERFVRRGVERAGLVGEGSGEALAAVGFQRCVNDLEDELIRALGDDAVLRIIEAQGELPSLRMLRQQPAQRDRTTHEHLHRFIGVRSGRKERYARLLAEALPAAAVPAPLQRLLDDVGR
jgi:hypothetical protein